MTAGNSEIPAAGGPRESSADRLDSCRHTWRPGDVGLFIQSGHRPGL